MPELAPTPVNTSAPEPAQLPRAGAEAIAMSSQKGILAVYRSKRQLMLANLLGGVAWGFGSVLGATIVVAIVLLLLRALGGLPIIGSYISEILHSISTTTRH